MSTASTPNKPSPEAPHGPYLTSTCQICGWTIKFAQAELDYVESRTVSCPHCGFPTKIQKPCGNWLSRMWSELRGDLRDCRDVLRPLWQKIGRWFWYAYIFLSKAVGLIGATAANICRMLYRFVSVGSVYVRQARARRESRRRKPPIIAEVFTGSPKPSPQPAPPEPQPRIFKGFIYILSNRAMPGLVKIGFSEAAPHLRAAELSGPTGVPCPFGVEDTFPVEMELRKAESILHEALARHRFHQNREFFQLSVSDARREVRRILYGT